MSNILDSAKQLLMDSTTARIGHLIQIELPGESGIFKYLTDYARDITYQGNVYASSSVKSIGSVKQTKTLNVYSVPVKVSGAVQEEIDTALKSESLIDRKIIIYKAFFDKNDKLIPLHADGSTTKYFEGVVTTLSVQDNLGTSGKGTSYVIWNCASSLHNFKAINGRLTDDESHRGLTTINGVSTPSTAAKRPEYQQDKGFAHANKSVKALASYQTKEKRYKIESKRAGGLRGLFGAQNTNLSEYWETVTREVNLDVNLTAKYLPAIYGVQKISGIPIFVDTISDNPDEVWVVYAFCEGEIDGFLDFYLDDAPMICLDSGNDPEKRVCVGTKRVKGDTISRAYAHTGVNPSSPSVHGNSYVFNDGYGDIEFWTFHGKSNQQAAQVLVDLAGKNAFKLQNGSGQAYWDTDFKLLDTAYAIFKIELNSERTNIPQISAEIQGKKVRIYNKDGTYDDSRTSTNFVWQALDYLGSSTYGGGITLDEIDLSSFTEVAALHDLIDNSYDAVWVPYWRYLGWTDYLAENRQVMQGSAFLNTSDTIFKNLDIILQQCDSSLNIVDGKYTLTTEAAGTSVADIHVNDIIDNKIDISDTTSKEKFNSVQASITDPAAGWGTNNITFFNADYKKEDKNKENKLSTVFPFITNYYTARSRTERLLNRSRFTRRVTFQLPFPYFWLATNDPITLTIPRYSWDKKQFLVEDLEWTPNGKVKVVAREYADGVFINSKQVDNSQNQIPDVVVSVLPPRDLTYTPDTENKIEGLNGFLSWLPSLTKDVAYYTIRWTGNIETEVLTVTGNQPLDARLVYNLFNLTEGTYVFEVRAANAAGIVSKPVNITVDMNATRNLPNISNFRVTNMASGTTDVFIGADVNFTWDALTDVQVNKLGYNIQILTLQDEILRDETIYNTIYYSYDLAKNKSDYQRLQGTLGFHRSLKARMRAVGDGGEASVGWTNI